MGGHELARRDVERELLEDRARRSVGPREGLGDALEDEPPLTPTPFWAPGDAPLDDGKDAVLKDGHHNAFATFEPTL